MPEVTQDSLLRTVREIAKFQKLPSIEKIRVEKKSSSEASFTVWIDGIANQFTGIFFRNSREREIVLSIKIPAWLKTEIEKVIKLLCDKICDNWSRRELLGWNDIPEGKVIEKVGRCA